MAANKDEFTCSVCQKLYTYPVVHRSCGFSFDRQCIGNKCPAQECGQIINEDDLIVNYDLMKIVDEHRLKLESPPTYYLILLDTSTSMWYSDSLLPFAIGKSRFTCAMQFLNEFFHIHLNSTTNKISLLTFDTSSLQRFDFETINQTHLNMLKSLECTGKDTALFDSIDFCLEKIDRLQQILKDEMPISYLFILTDGGSNFGKKESEHATRVLWRSKKLHISGHMIQIGNTNRKKTRAICDFIKYQYNYFNEGNVKEFVNSFSNSIKTETRARVSQARASKARFASNAETLLIDQLPSVPTGPIKVSSKKQVLA